MSDITVTAADVRPLPGADIARMQAGGTVSVGALVYVVDDGDVEHTDSSAIGTTLPALGIVCGALDGDTSGAATEWVDVVIGGRVTGFSGMTPGNIIYASDNVGAVADAVGASDLIVGLALSATVLLVRIETIDLT